MPLSLVARSLARLLTFPACLALLACAASVCAGAKSDSPATIEVAYFTRQPVIVMAQKHGFFADENLIARLTWTGSPRRKAACTTCRIGVALPKAGRNDIS